MIYVFCKVFYYIKLESATILFLFLNITCKKLLYHILILDTQFILDSFIGSILYSNSNRLVVAYTHTRFIFYQDTLVYKINELEFFLNCMEHVYNAMKLIKHYTTHLKILLCISLLALYVPVYGQYVYEASTLHNAASRSQTVQQIFYQRWDTIFSNYLRFDAYIQLNWVYDFYVNTYNRGTGTTQAVPMRLVRTFSDMAVLFPVYTPETETPDETQPADITDVSTFRKPWVENSILLGFTVCGYHYGLTRTVDINRGYAGSESASDYAFSQFFDDIVALTAVFVPYVTLHAGVVFNQQIEPNEDGTLDYNFDPSTITKRYFMSLSLFNTLTWRSTAAKDRLESYDISLTVTQFSSYMVTIPEFVPHITIGYKKYEKYNDEPYDPVWVSTANGKSDTMSSSLKQHATLYTYYTVLSKQFGNFYLAASLELQYADKTLIDKRTQQNVSLPFMRLWWAKAGYDLFDRPEWDLIIWFGVNKFYDPAISYHSKHSDNDTGGWFALIDGTTPYITLSIKASYNDAQELDTLVEAVDKFVLEGSASFRI